MGYTQCRIDQIYGSAYIAAQYLKEKCPDINKVRVIGMNSIRKELKEVGIESVGGQDLEGYDDGKMDFSQFEKASVDPEIMAVVVGLDTEFTYSKLALASLYIQAGAKFIATNDDAYDNINGRKMPGAGAMVYSIQTSLKN